ncbi:MAG TPA: hypothetical protein PKA06_02280 [Gemmatales bacterium]|nr:hypothetical protein [Gemmatales bacterium]
MNWKIILAFAFLLGIGVVLYFMLNQGPKKLPLGKEVGKEYWISVASAEIAAKTKDGKSWDVNNSGPDVFYEIWWKGNRVYQSSVCTDSLIAKWDAQEIDLGKILRTQRIEASKAGAIIKVGDDNNITIKVYDSDLAVNDLIDEFQIDISKLSGTTIDLSSGPTKQCQKLSLLVVPVE